MNSELPSNPIIAAFVGAINRLDRDALLALCTTDVTLADDGTPRDVREWIDREIFSVHGHMVVKREDEGGLRVFAHFHNDTWGEMSTVWRFEISAEKITAIETGQA